MFTDGGLAPSKATTGVGSSSSLRPRQQQQPSKRSLAAMQSFLQRLADENELAGEQEQPTTHGTTATVATEIIDDNDVNAILRDSTTTSTSTSTSTSSSTHPDWLMPALIACHDQFLAVVAAQLAVSPRSILPPKQRTHHPATNKTNVAAVEGEGLCRINPARVESALHSLGMSDLLLPLRQRSAPKVGRLHRKQDQPLPTIPIASALLGSTKDGVRLLADNEDDHAPTTATSRTANGRRLHNPAVGHAAAKKNKKKKWTLLDESEQERLLALSKDKLLQQQQTF